MRRILSSSNRMIYSFTFNIVRIAKELTEMVGAPGLEPETSSLSETRSNQLSYAPALHSKNVIVSQCFLMVELVGFEPATSCLQSRRSTSELQPQIKPGNQL